MINFRLDQFLDDLGEGVVEVIAAPRGLDVSVGFPVIYDPTEPLLLGDDEILMAVGVSPFAPTAADLVKQAGTEGAVAVFVKHRGSPPAELVEAANEAGVAVIGVEPEMTWTQLFTLVRIVMASTGQSPEVPSNGSTPIGDLFGLANAVAATVGGAVAIEDPRGCVLAYSSLGTPIDEPRRSSILGRQIPDRWGDLLRELGVFRQLWTSDDVVRVEGVGEPGELRPRLAIVVKAGKEVLGSIWVAEGDTPFAAGAEAALREAAKITALHMVRNRYGEDVERRTRGDVLRRILDGRGPVGHLAAKLKLGLESEYVVVAFELQSDEEAVVAYQRERALRIVASYCEGYRRRAAHTAVGRVIYTLVPLKSSQSIDGVRRLAGDVLRAGESYLPFPLRAGIGSIASSLREVPASRDDADLVLRIIASHGDAGTGATAIDDVRHQALLIHLRELLAERPDLLAGKVDKLYRYDDEHHGALVETLGAYLDHFGSVPSAAGALGVHHNTFRYRIQRVCDVSGLDLADAEDRFAAELELRLGMRLGVRR